MATYISNAFSLSMLPGGAHHTLEIDCRCDPKQLYLAGTVSIVGHEDTARVFSTLLGWEVPCNRVSVKLEVGDFVIVGQYTGPRLRARATSLPEGASISWFVIEVR